MSKLERIGASTGVVVASGTSTVDVTLSATQNVESTVVSASLAAYSLGRTYKVTASVRVNNSANTATVDLRVRTAAGAIQLVRGTYGPSIISTPLTYYLFGYTKTLSGPLSLVLTGTNSSASASTITCQGTVDPTFLYVEDVTGGR